MQYCWRWADDELNAWGECRQARGVFQDASGLVSRTGAQCPPLPWTIQRCCGMEILLSCEAQCTGALCHSPSPHHGDRIERADTAITVRVRQRAPCAGGRGYYSPLHASLRGSG